MYHTAVFKMLTCPCDYSLLGHKSLVCTAGSSKELAAVWRNIIAMAAVPQDLREKSRADPVTAPRPS